MMKPDWLVKGALIKFAWCVGQVVDIAVSDERVMVLVASLKGVWRHHDAEWLEYHPGMIELATPDDVQRDIEKYQAHIQKTFDDFEALRAQWQSILLASPARIESPGFRNDARYTNENFPTNAKEHG